MSAETVPENRRLYLIFEPSTAGKVAIRLSVTPPDVDQALAALIVRGMLMNGSVVDVELVSDPKQDPDLEGPPGDIGPNGWTPMLVAEADGTRTLVKVADWVRSAGKPATGYLTASAALAPTKSDGFNFNASKRVLAFSSVSNAAGIASVAFGNAFTAAPQVVVVGAVPNLPVGGIKAEIVAGSVTKSGCQVKITGAALLSSVVTALAGATANVIAIES